MDQFGALSLGDFPITAPGTFLGTPIVGLYGLSGLAVQARLGYGSGGASCRTYVQTSLDQGQTWLDVACFAFATASAVLAGNIDGRAATALLTPGDGVLADGALLQGLLGDQLRVKVVTTGTYGSSTLLSAWAVAR